MEKCDGEPQVCGEIVARDLVVKRGGKTVLDGVSFTLRPGVITGLIGPNAVGKTTLAATIAGRIKPASGSIAIDGAQPFDNADVMTTVTLVGDGCDYAKHAKVTKSMRIWAATKPAWNAQTSADILTHFGITKTTVPSKISLGQRSGISIAIGLAANSPVTIYDEVTVGLDATNRQRFTEAVLGAYSQNPQTTILSSHLIDELENTVEDVLVLSPHGVAFHGSVEQLRQAVVSVTGPPERVAHVLGERNVLRSRDLGPVQQVSVLVDDELRSAALANDLTLQNLSLQEATIALTWKGEAGWL